MHLQWCYVTNPAPSQTLDCCFAAKIKPVLSSCQPLSTCTCIKAHLDVLQVLAKAHQLLHSVPDNALFQMKQHGLGCGVSLNVLNGLSWQAYWPHKTAVPKSTGILYTVVLHKPRPRPCAVRHMKQSKGAYMYRRHTDHGNLASVCSKIL